MHLVLALFWLVLGVLGQVFWDTLRPHSLIPVDRVVFGFIFFVLFSFNMVRWRMARRVKQMYEDTVEPPPRPRIEREYDPTFDFTKPEGDETKPPPK